MTEREKLLDLIDEAAELHRSEREAIADHLLANGVIVQKWIPVTEQGAKPTTNGDRIRAMSDEELAEYIGQHTLCDRIQDEGDWCDKRAVCRECITDWLRQPVKEAL